MAATTARAARPFVQPRSSCALAAALLALAACAPDAVLPSGPVDPPAPALDGSAPATPAGDPRARGVVRPAHAARDSVMLRRRLEQAAAGLLYTSESDFPLEYWAGSGRVTGALDVAAFRAAAGLPPDAEVEVRTVADVLARHIERVDPADPVAVVQRPRWRWLRRTLERSLHGAVAFRVGRIQVRCYLVGLDAHGRVVGLLTTAIET